MSVNDRRTYGSTDHQQPLTVHIINPHQNDTSNFLMSDSTPEEINSNSLMMEQIRDDHKYSKPMMKPSLTGPSSSSEKRLLYIIGQNRQKFLSNSITTGKYNLISFVPKFLFEQFRRYANIFFLFIALMQQIPNVSPTGRFTTAVPLICIFIVSALKEIFEDIQRHKSDHGVNRTPVWVLNRETTQWETKCWHEVIVGDLVKVMNDQFFPSDLLLVSSCEPNGMCYIETSNLDGETNLKIRESLRSTAHCITAEKLISDLRYASIECDLPNRHLYEFCGNLKMGENMYPIGPENILLRGSKLRNTNWIFGCVLYTGHESKIMLNSTARAPLKRSNVDRVTNIQILFLFGVLLVIGLISAGAQTVWAHGNSHWYLEGLEDKLSSNFFFVLLTFIILYNNLVPISLQVTIEIVRFAQAHFINSDIEMYDEETDTPATARTSNLNEELGQVKYILSDKTGTLTRNVMEFKRCSIAGVVYGEENFEQMLKLVKTNKPEGIRIREFFTLLAVCQTVVPETKHDQFDENGKPLINYMAASPDEGALVDGARKLGFEFTTRTPQHVLINVLGKEEKYEILNVLEFTSDRKRMSVIIRDPNNKIKLYIKGADTMIYDRLANDNFADVTETHLSQFAKIGLRTLSIAYVDIEEFAYNEWNKRLTTALLSTGGPGGESREDYINNVMAEVEVKLNLIGATAIEDRLQEGVPEAIDTLLKAGIKIWVLTGDKQETAINIGHSSKLFNHGMPLIILDENSTEATREAIHEARDKVSSNTGLVIEGQTLNYALSPDICKDFMDISLKCKSVICCRVSPAQKAEVVKGIKDSTGQITLAIGDGANDVAMIRAAHVGVGISGHEGLQAAHNADYAIGQFRFLTRLLLVHGAWSLGRLCKLILYSFYKNIALYIIELWFASVSAWSGQTIFERWTIGLYNVMFTAAPPLAIGLFDRQCTAETMMKYPGLYPSHSKLFNVRLFWVWISTAIWHSLLLFWLTYFAIWNDTLWAHGRSDGGYLVFGNMLYTYVVVTVCLKAGLEISSWTMWTHISIWGSIALWFIFLLIYSRFWPKIPIASGMASIDQFVFSSAVFWMGLCIIPFMTLLIDIVYKIIARTCFKTLAERLTEIELEQSPPTDTVISCMFRTVFNKNSKNTRRTRKQETEIEHQHGYAFSQEERGSVRQSQLIRVYDTTKIKPSGI